MSNSFFGVLASALAGGETPPPTISGILGVSCGGGATVDTFTLTDMQRRTDPDTNPTGTVTDIAINPAGTLLAASHLNSPFITIYDAVTMEKLPDPADLATFAGRGVTFSKDGSLLLLTGLISNPTFPSFPLYDTSDWSIAHVFSTLTNGTHYGCDFSPDDSILAIGFSNSPYIRLINTSTWTNISNPSVLPAGTVGKVKFSNDGSMLAILHTGTAPNLTVYDTSTWAKVNTAMVDNPAINLVSDYALAWSPDDSLLAVGHDNSPHLSIYNTSTWARLSQPSTSPDDDVRGVVFSGDGARLYTVSLNSTGRFLFYDVSDWSTIPSIADEDSNGIGIIAVWGET